MKEALVGVLEYLLLINKIELVRATKFKLADEQKYDEASKLRAEELELLKQIPSINVWEAYLENIKKM